jgi:hypothetical protein
LGVACLQAYVFTYWFLFIQTTYLVLVIKSNFSSNTLRLYDYLSNYYILNIYDYSKSINEFILYKEKFFEENKKAVIKFYINNNKLNLLNFSINFLNIYIIISKINLKYIIMKKYIYRKNNKKLLSLLN